MNSKEIILSNIIGLNPTGTLDFNGTYSMNGNDNIVRNLSSASKENLVKAQKNKIVCKQIEKFENFNNENNNNLYNIKNIKNIILIILIIILLFIIFLI